MFRNRVRTKIGLLFYTLFHLDKITSFSRLFKVFFQLYMNENIKNLLLNAEISYAANRNGNLTYVTVQKLIIAKFYTLKLNSDIESYKMQESSKCWR